MSRWEPVEPACAACHSLWYEKLVALRARMARHDAELIEAFVCGWRHEGDLWLLRRQAREEDDAAQAVR